MTIISWLAASVPPTLTHPIDRHMVATANSHEAITRRRSNT